MLHRVLRRPADTQKLHPVDTSTQHVWWPGLDWLGFGFPPQQGGHLDSTDTPGWRASSWLSVSISGPAGGLFRTAWCWTALVGGYLANSACRTGERNHSDWLSICRCSIHDFIHLELLILIFPDIFYLRIGYIDVNCVKKCCLIIPMVFISEV